MTGEVFLLNLLESLPYPQCKWVVEAAVVEARKQQKLPRRKCGIEFPLPLTRDVAGTRASGCVVMGSALGARVKEAVIAPFYRKSWEDLVYWEKGTPWLDDITAHGDLTGRPVPNPDPGPPGFAAHTVLNLSKAMAEALFGGTRKRSVILLGDRGIEVVAERIADRLAALLPGKQSCAKKAAVLTALRGGAERCLKSNEGQFHRLCKALLQHGSLQGPALDDLLWDVQPFDIRADFKAQLGVLLPATWP